MIETFLSVVVRNKSPIVNSLLNNNPNFSSTFLIIFHAWRFLLHRMIKSNHNDHSSLDIYWLTIMFSIVVVRLKVSESFRWDTIMSKLIKRTIVTLIRADTLMFWFSLTRLLFMYSLISFYFSVRVNEKWKNLLTREGETCTAIMLFYFWLLLNLQKKNLLHVFFNSVLPLLLVNNYRFRFCKFILSIHI